MPAATSVLLVGTPGTADQLRKAFEDHTPDWTILEAETLAEARRTLERSSPDCIVAATKLPDGTGVELLQQLRSETGPAFVLVDPDGDEVALQRALAEGVSHYVPDPFDGDNATAIVERVEALIRRRRERDQEPGAKLARHEAYLEHVLDTFPDVVYILDAEGRLADWNRAVPDVTGYEPEELEGMPATDFFREEDVVDLLEAIEDTFEQGTRRFEAPLVTKAGDALPYEFHSAATEDPDGEPVLVGIGRDITEQKERERRLERQRHQLALLNRIVRHDIRNDMTGVTSLARMLAEEAPEQIREDLEMMAGTGEHVVELTETVRALVTMIMEGGELETGPTPLSPSVRTETAQARRSFPAATITVEEPLPDVEVVGNPLLAAIVRNLVNNAVQHNDEDEPRVEVRARVEGDRAVLEVADNGPGIPDDRKHQLFEGPSDELFDEDVSLGLFLVRTVVDQFGGTIRVEDNQPEGAVFVVELPLAGERR